MLVLTVISAILISFVPVNKDRTKYLADDSNMKQGLTIMQSDFPENAMMFRNDDIPTTEVPLWLLLAAVGLMIVILLIMCYSWLEPALLLITTGIAVLINMGTNIVFPYIDEMTLSIGPIIQLVLSMDYSIILMNRYLQEKDHHADGKEAMKAALAGSVSSIASSSFTTAAGLMALVFLSFRLGPELGIVLAKGVLISMVCVLTILPGLILLCDQWITKTRKRSPHIPMGRFAALSCKTRYVMPAIFIAMFACFFILQGSAQISFLEQNEDPIEGISSKENTVALLYRTEEEEQTEQVIDGMEADERVTSVLAFRNTLGKSCDVTEMGGMLRELMEGTEKEAGTGIKIDDRMIQMLYMYYQMQHGSAEMTVPQLFNYLCDELMETPLLAGYFDEETKNMILSQREELQEAIAQMRGPVYSRLVIRSEYPEESEETGAFIDRLKELCDSGFREYYLIGTSVMAHEMNATFEKEYLLITLITAIAIFLVVLIAFRSPVIPLILTLLVQCGVFITVTVIGAYTGSIYYLALLIVQSILMGATIDYGIVFCNIYKESRKTLDMEASLKSAYERSVHTIMTSGTILVLVLAALGVFAPAVIIREVCITLSIGALVAILLILFVLPGLIACFDRFIMKTQRL